jgi:hypothetical protein
MHRGLLTGEWGMKGFKLGMMALVALSMAACTAEKTEEGEMPEVNVEGGNMPKYDVDPAQVEVGTDTTKVVTPDVDIKPQSTTN